MNERKTIKGVIEDKEIKFYTNKEGNEGNLVIIKIAGKSYSCFDKSLLEKYNIEDTIEFDYVEKQNGPYLNRNILNVKEDLSVSLSKETLDKIQAVGKTMEKTGKMANQEGFKEEYNKELDKKGLITPKLVFKQEFEIQDKKYLLEIKEK